MATSFELDAELREDEGKGASRRLRLQGKVPAVIYGGGRKPRSITLNHNALMKHARNEAFFAHVLKIKVGDVEQSAIVKDIQTHPARSLIMHVDFQRVMAGVEIRMTVPLHFINEDTSHAVKMLGAVVSHLKNEVDIECLPKNLPEYIEVDMEHVGMDEMLHMADIKLPKGVEIPELAQGEDYNQPIVSVHLPKKVEEEPTEEEAAAAEAAAAAADAETPDEDDDAKDS